MLDELVELDLLFEASETVVEDVEVAMAGADLKVFELVPAGDELLMLVILLDADCLRIMVYGEEENDAAAQILISLAVLLAAYALGHFDDLLRVLGQARLGVVDVLEQ